nr:MAG TPA: hypothetical protein [Caudoviricetes sp.]
MLLFNCHQFHAIGCHIRQEGAQAIGRDKQVFSVKALEVCKGSGFYHDIFVEIRKVEIDPADVIICCSLRGGFLLELCKGHCELSVFVSVSFHGGCSFRCSYTSTTNFFVGLSFTSFLIALFSFLVVKSSAYQVFIIWDSLPFSTRETIFATFLIVTVMIFCSFRLVRFLNFLT